MLYPLSYGGSRPEAGWGVPVEVSGPLSGPSSRRSRSSLGQTGPGARLKVDPGEPGPDRLGVRRSSWPASQ